MEEKKLKQDKQLTGGTLKKYAFKPMTNKKYSKLNEIYVNKTNGQFKESDKASFRSSRKMGRILLG